MFATINIQKIKTDAELEARYRHNRRIGKISANVREEQMARNKHSKKNTSEVSKDTFRKVQASRMAAGANQMRKTTVKAVELVMGASGEYFEGKSDAEVIDWAKTQIEWAKDYYKDRGKLIGTDLHLDETTPHIHLIFAPLTKKPDKKTGKTLYTYSAKEFVGNKSEMNRMRSSHAEANMQYGLERGKNYYQEGEKPPEYVKSIKEFRRQGKADLKEAEEFLQSISIDDLREFIEERDEMAEFEKELAEAFDTKDKPEMVRIARKVSNPKKKPSNTRDMTPRG